MNLLRKLFPDQFDLPQLQLRKGVSAKHGNRDLDQILFHVHFLYPAGKTF